MESINRRSFLKESCRTVVSLAAAATVVAPARIRAASPNDVIRVAVVGFNGRGAGHINAFLPSAGIGTEIGALVDIDDAVLEQGISKVEKNQGRSPGAYADVRKMLEDKSVDAVSIATPNHWHSLAAIWAIQAGKDVYVEKPLSHNVFEGRKLVQAAGKYGRIVQHGTQSRSSGGVREAIEALRNGVIGKVYMAKGHCFKWRPSIGKVTEPTPVPKGVDYDLWCGPAPMKPIRRQRFHYDWHWQWDYGNGDIGNQGVHEMDIARWGLGVGLPRAVFSDGGRFGYEDDGETPNTQHAIFEYDDSVLQFEVRGLPTNDERNVKVGNIFYGSTGYMVVNGGKWQTFMGANSEPGPSGPTKDAHGVDHFQNFVEAMKTRNAATLNAPVEEGHLSSALCHLANISYRLGRKLHFDAKSERFVGDNGADWLLTRDYRSPYAVPEIV
jgi:predicted dehydrogenase